MASAEKIDLKQHAEDLGKQVDRAVRKAGPYIEKIARFGIAARGVTYLLLGGLAILAAIGMRGGMTSTGGMLQVLIDRPIGWIIFIGLAVGFAGFGFWQWVRAIRDPDRTGTEWPALGKRFAWFWSGTINLIMVFVAIQIIARGRSRDVSGDAITQSWVGWGMQYPLGRWVVAGTGVGMIIYGFSEMLCAWRMDPAEMLHASDLTPWVRGMICRIGRFGIAARGIVFGMIGVFLMLAAWYQRPGEAKGQGGVLRVLEHQRFGTALLTLVAAGLIAYGAYALVLARYRRIRTK